MSLSPTKAHQVLEERVTAALANLAAARPVAIARNGHFPLEACATAYLAGLAPTAEDLQSRSLKSTFGLEGLGAWLEAVGDLAKRLSEGVVWPQAVLTDPLDELEALAQDLVVRVVAEIEAVPVRAAVAEETERRQAEQAERAAVAIEAAGERARTAIASVRAVAESLEAVAQEIGGVLRYPVEARNRLDEAKSAANGADALSASLARAEERHDAPAAERAAARAEELAEQVRGRLTAAEVFRDSRQGRAEPKDTEVNRQQPERKERTMDEPRLNYRERAERLRNRLEGKGATQESVDEVVRIMLGPDPDSKEVPPTLAAGLKTPSQVRDEVAEIERQRAATPEGRIERTLRYASTLAGAGLSREDAVDVAKGAYPLPGRSDLGVRGLEATKRELARWRGHVVRTLLGSGWEEADAEKLASKLFPSVDHL